MSRTTSQNRVTFADDINPTNTANNDTTTVNGHSLDHNDESLAEDLRTAVVDVNDSVQDIDNSTITRGIKYRLFDHLFVQ